LRVELSERLPDQETKSRDRRGRVDPKVEERRRGEGVVGERRGEVNGGAARRVS